MTKIAFVRLTSRGYYGGLAHENAIITALSDDFEVELIDVGPTKSSRSKYLEAPIVVWNLFKLSRRKGFDIVIRNFESSLFLNRRLVKNVFSLFHIDPHHGPLNYKLFHLLLGKYVMRKLSRNADASVVMSKYWRRFLKERGFKNIYLAYVPSNPEEFEFTAKEIEDFKNRFDLTGRPIIYLGLARKDKGVEESFNSLKHLDCHFVASISPSFVGESPFKAPVRVLRLEYRDYLRLLKASSVAVIMSQITEGWSINAQEAMLCRTPVVGSGKGGMGELLERGGQLVCQNFEELPKKVEFAMLNPELGEKGYQFAKTRTFEKFKQDWVGVINSLIDSK